MKIIYKYTIDVKQGSDLTVEMPEKYNIVKKHYKPGMARKAFVYGQKLKQTIK